MNVLFHFALRSRYISNSGCTCTGAHSEFSPRWTKMKRAAFLFETTGGACTLHAAWFWLWPVLLPPYPIRWRGPSRHRFQGRAPDGSDILLNCDAHFYRLFKQAQGRTYSLYRSATIEMLFSLATTTSLLTLLAAHAYANPVQIGHRDTVFPTTIAAPTAGTTISPGDSFNFSYTPADYCFEAYSPLTVWLLASSPTATDLNSTMGFSEYLFYFGQYTAADDPGM